MIAKHWLANIGIECACICWIQIHSTEAGWIVISCRWVSIDVWKAISSRWVICIHHCLQCLVVACHHVSIIYFFELVGVHRSITRSISIVVWNHITTAISSCALTLWSACWTCCTVRARRAISWGHCGKNSLVRTVVWIINYLGIASVHIISACISWGNIRSLIHGWIVVRNSWGSICAWQAILLSWQI